MMVGCPARSCRSPQRHDRIVVDRCCPVALRDLRLIKRLLGVRQSPVDRLGAVDMRSMKADNISAFNCRYRNGVCCTWSMHAFGKAIDINPVENRTSVPGGLTADRREVREPVT